MKTQIFSLLFILTGLVLVLVFWQNSGPLNKTEPPLFAFAQEEVAAFRIHSFAEGYYFEKQNDGWQVKKILTDLLTNFDSKTNPEDQVFAKANPVPVTQMLTHLFLLPKGEPVATEAESVAKFHINPHSLHIIFYDAQNAELGRLYVGKPGSDWISTFIKLNDEPAVYQVDKNLNELLSKPFEAWTLTPENP